MRNKLTFFAGLGVGYVLGSRAGRQRYEQIMESVNRLKENPTFQEASGIIQAQAASAKETVSDKLQNTSWGAKVGQLLSTDDQGDQSSTRQFETAGVRSGSSTTGTTGSTTGTTGTTGSAVTSGTTAGRSTTSTSTSGF